MFPGALCPDHPAQAAARVCDRCGRFICAACETRLEDKIVCPPCSQRMPSLFGGSWFSIAAGIASFIGLGCSPFALVAAGLAIFDLIRMAATGQRKDGKLLDLIALGFAALGLVIGYAVLQRFMHPAPASSTYDSDF